MSIKINNKALQKAQINGKEVQKIVINGNTVYQKVLAPLEVLSKTFDSITENSAQSSKTKTLTFTDYSPAGGILIHYLVIDSSRDIVNYSDTVSGGNQNIVKYNSYFAGGANIVSPLSFTVNHGSTYNLLAYGYFILNRPVKSVTLVKSTTSLSITLDPGDYIICRIKKSGSNFTLSPSSAYTDISAKITNVGYKLNSSDSSANTIYITSYFIRLASTQTLTMNNAGTYDIYKIE